MSWGRFLKNLKKFQKKFHILVPIYFDILMHDCVQRSFTSAMCPGTHTSFFILIAWYRSRINVLCMRSTMCDWNQIKILIHLFGESHYSYLGTPVPCGSPLLPGTPSLVSGRHYYLVCLPWMRLFQLLDPWLVQKLTLSGAT